MIFIFVHLGTNELLYNDGGLWLLPTSYLGFVLGYGGGDNFIWIGDGITAFIITVLVYWIYNSFASNDIRE